MGSSSVSLCSFDTSIITVYLVTFHKYLASNSAIGYHFLQNPACAQHYDDSRFSILAALLSIYLLLKPLSSKLLTLPAADKKNLCTASRLCTNDTFSLVFFQPITTWLFLQIAALYPALSVSLYQILVTNFLGTLLKVVVQPPIQFTTKIFLLNFCFMPPQSTFPWQRDKNRKNCHNSATAHARCKFFF